MTPIPAPPIILGAQLACSGALRLKMTAAEDEPMSSSHTTPSSESLFARMAQPNR